LPHWKAIMASALERRIEALEERQRASNPRIAVIRQNEDGSWPPEPPGAALVIALRRMGLPDSAGSLAEVN